jgi:hypothetical protein
MLKRWTVLIACSMYLAFAHDATAFFDPPFVAPVTPLAGELVSVNIHIGVCDVIFNHAGYPQITRYGNAVRIVVYGQHWDPGELCTYPIGTATHPIGRFAPGNYTVSFDLYYRDYFADPQTLHFGTMPFTVAGPAQPAVSAPALDAIGLGILVLLMSFFGSRRLLAARAGRQPGYLGREQA